MRIEQAFVAAVIAVATTSVLAEAPTSQWKYVGTLGQRHMMVVDAAAAGDAKLLKQAAATACVAGKPCVVAFWEDAAAVPKVMPMTSAEQQAMVAQYMRNPASGKEELLLKCAPGESAGAKCLR